jgi:hypothetical protein
MVTWRCTATALAALCGAGLACSPGAERPAAITSVDPSSAYNDVARPLVLAGTDFRPAYEFDTVSAAASVEAGFSGMLLPVDAAAGLPPVAIDPVSWAGPRRLRAMLPDGVPAGTYDVRITDPRGDVIELPAGFTSLGPDVDPPTVLLANPGDDTIVGEGTDVTVTLSASDGSGELTALTWSVTWSDGMLSGACDVVARTGPMPCSFGFTAPTPVSGPEPLLIQVEAVDRKGIHGFDDVTLLLAPRPTLTELSPGKGQASGGTLLTVRGTNFVPPNSVSLGTVVVIDGELLVTEFLSETELRATTRPHDPGAGSVSVRTGGAESPSRIFGFFAAPIVKAIEPASGPEAGGNWVTIVGRYFGPDTEIWLSDGFSWSDRIKPAYLKSMSRIEGFAPPGTGTVNVVAYNPNGGIGQLLGAYVYESDQSGQ